MYWFIHSANSKSLAFCALFDVRVQANIKSPTVIKFQLLSIAS